MRPTVYISAAVHSRRLQWTLHVLFERILKVSWQLLPEHTPWPSCGLRISYGTARVDAHLHIPESGFLRESSIRPFTPDWSKWHSCPILFPLEGPCPFDLFAAAFFLLSRYEEYLPFQADAFGRFPAAASWAGKQGLLTIPLVDWWADRLRQLAQARLPRFSWPKVARQWQPTCDVDMAWAWKHRPWWRMLGAMWREAWHGQLHLWVDRWRTLRGLQPDPFDTFERMEAHFRQAPRQPYFFLHVGPWGCYDKNIPLRHPAMQQLVQQRLAFAQIGLHPSWQQGQHAAGIRREQEALQRVLGRAIVDSRHHYLRIRLPHTYRQLIAAGIQRDWSMGFADHPGFRAGTAHPFPWYDLAQEQITSLEVIPLIAMDVSWKQYLSFSPDQALKHLRTLWDHLKPAGGLLTTLWHNSSLPPAVGWQEWEIVAFPPWLKQSDHHPTTSSGQCRK